MYYRTYDLPWSAPANEDRNFRIIALWVIATALLLSVIVPVLPVKKADPMMAPPPLPPRLAQLIIERARSTPPPPPKIEPAPEVLPEPPAAVKTPEPKPVPLPEPTPRVAPEPAKPAPLKPVQDRDDARKRAKATGVLALADELADLRDQPVTVALDRKPVIAATGSADRNDRALITTNAAAASGGINTADLSRNTGGAALSGRESTRVASRVASRAKASQQPAATRVSGDSQVGSRSREEIEMVFDRNKAAIFALYNRALRRDPDLAGKVVLRLTIEPDGAVSACEVLSSDLGAPALEAKLIRRVKLFRFESRDVATVTTTKPIDFFPA